MSTIPITVLTGFLGSGKTTLLRELLAHSGLAETAVLINELGEVALDHLLVRQVSEDIVVLGSGCICCNVRGDLITALRDLFLRRVRGEVPEFQRLVIETTGLADPAPILHTLMTDPLIGARYRLDGVVATVDAVTGNRTLDRQREAVKQAAIADRLVLTKTDLADPTDTEVLRARLRGLNPAAPILVALHGRLDPSTILDAGLFNTRDKAPDVARWLAAEAYPSEAPSCGPDCGHDHHDHHHHPAAERHPDGIESFVVAFDRPVPWPNLAAGLELLVATRGENILRLKGIVHAEGIDHPIVIHGVQHVFHPPAPLEAWPDADRSTRIVLITRDIGRHAVERLIRSMVADDHTVD